MGQSNIDNLMLEFRSVPKPGMVEGCTWGCCPSTEDIQRLLDRDPSSLSVSDLLPYVSSVLMTVGSPAAFTFLLPTSLAIWGQEITRNQSGYVEQLHAALKRQNFFDGLPNRLRLAATRYMRRRILEVLEQQDTLDVQGMSPVHGWISVVGSYGVITRDIPALWKEWWELSCEGYSVAAVQLASLIVCEPVRNPVFPPWTPNKGGGPSDPWEFASAGFEERWHDSNISFLRDVLSVGYLEEKLTVAEQSMRSQDLVATTMSVRAILASESSRVRERISVLLSRLGTPSEP